MYVFFNPHPQKKIVGDCVKRAIVVATGNDYRDVQNELNRIKRKKNAKHYNEKEVYDTYLTQHSFKLVSFPAVKGQKRMTVSKLASMSNKDDVYVCNCAHHLVGIKDNNYWDTWDSGDKCVYTAYKYMG